MTALTALTVYLFTLAPTVIHLDSGELAAVQSTLGIAHPTGYPLFTLIGYLFSLLLFPFSKIFALNLLSALFCTVGVYFITSSTKLILDNFQNKEANTNYLLTEKQKAVVSSVIGLMAAFSATFWFQSTSVEVYSLHLAIITTTIFFIFRAYYSNSEKQWLLAAVFLALGFTNHMTTILIIPALAYIFFLNKGFNKNSFLLIVKMLAIFLPVLAIFYAYLPLRAITEPSLNWGNPVDLERFFRHVSGKQYQVWIFSSLEAAISQLEYFLKILPRELGYIGLVISIGGLFYLFKKSKVVTLFFVISFLSTLLYSVNYDIADIDAYFLLAFISLIFFAIGFYVEIIKRTKGKFIYSFFAVPILFIFINFSDVDQSEVKTFEDYTKAMLDQAEENSIIFSYLWDYFISPSYYFQYVEKYRNDVAVIDKELLRRSWYFDQLKNNIPGVIEKINPEIENFLIALEPFEKDENYEPELIEKRYRKLMTQLVAANIEEYNFYVTPELFENELRRGEFTLPNGYQLVPLELYFKVVPENTGYVEAEPTQITIRFNKIENPYQKQIRNLVFNMMIYRILYELQFQKNDKAISIYKELKSNFPEIRIPQIVLDRIQAKK